MQLRYFLWTFLIVFAIDISLFAQNQNALDSLFMQLNIAKNNIEKVNILNEIANEFQASQPLIAYEYAQQALYFAEQSSYKKGTADAYLQIAGSYYFQGNYFKDSEYLLKALPMYEILEDSTKIAKIYGYLGSVYEAQKEYDKQIDYFHKALKIAKSVKDEKFVATLLSNGLGNAYIQQKNIDRALMYHYEALRIREKINDNWGLANSFLYIGEAYIAQKDYPKAKSYFEKSLELNRKINDKHGLSLSYLQLGKVEYIKENYKKSAILFDSSLQVASNAHLQPDVKAACDGLALAYTKLNNYSAAYKFLNLSVAIKDSLYNEESNKKIADLQAAFEIKKHQKEVEKQNAERERKNSLQYSGIFFFTILLFVCIFIFGKFNIAVSFVEKMLFFTFLLCFEFILLLTDPYIEAITQREPFLVLLANAIIALFIVPIHQFLEHKLKNKWFRNDPTIRANNTLDNSARRSEVEINSSL